MKWPAVPIKLVWSYSGRPACALPKFLASITLFVSKSVISIRHRLHKNFCSKLPTLNGSCLGLFNRQNFWTSV